MDKVFLDCNIILDWIIDRPPFSVYATDLINLIEKKKVKAFVNPLVLSNAHYIIQKSCNKKISQSFLEDSIKVFSVLDLSSSATKKSIKNPYKDFEDDLHQNSAIENKITTIITRNLKDFNPKKSTVLTAEEYLIEKGHL